MAVMHDDPLHGLTVLERGWLSSNNLLVHAARGEAGAVLIDTSHVNHAPQTLALVTHALAGAPLARVLNTHLHSDHCGGNATLQKAFGVPVAIPPGQAEAVRTWDESVLSYAATGQRIERWTLDGIVAPGDGVVAGGREWQVLPAPGHDPHSVMFFDAAHGVLVSADALWEHGFGLVFPEIAGEPGFDDVGATLELIAGLPVRCVVPGHGAPFADVRGALDRARARLAGLQADPARHAKHALKVLVKYHLMEERAQDEAALTAWALATPLLADLWQRFAPRGVPSAQAWITLAVDEMLQGGALRREGSLLLDA
jgi:glyoxylase-like metal-dependent hydrolase (beta-lactamase superfamily II)